MRGQAGGFPTLLAAALRRGRMTPGSLADHLGCSERAVLDWQAGRTLPPVSRLRGLSDALGIPAEVLLDALADEPGRRAGGG